MGILQRLTVGNGMFDKGKGMKIQWLGRVNVCRCREIKSRSGKLSEIP